MKIPKKLHKPIFISIILIIVISLLLIIFLGFNCTQKILGFIASIICIPTSISSLVGIMYVIDEGKIINNALIEAKKNDKEEWKKIEEKMNKYK